MGYTLYLRRLPRLDAVTFQTASDDIKTICREVERLGVPLAGPRGYGPVQAGADRIAFNGLKECGHPFRRLDHSYPAPDAEGFEFVHDPVVGAHWAGALLKARSCGGDCTAEAFVLDRIYPAEAWEKKTEDGFYRQHFTTDFKPYDLAVGAVLVRLKHHFGAEVAVDTDDGSMEHLREAVAICRRLFEKHSLFVIEPEQKPGPEIVPGVEGC